MQGTKSWCTITTQYSGARWKTTLSSLLYISPNDLAELFLQRKVFLLSWRKGNLLAWALLSAVLSFYLRIELFLDAFLIEFLLRCRHIRRRLARNDEDSVTMSPEPSVLSIIQRSRAHRRSSAISSQLSKIRTNKRRRRNIISAKLRYNERITGPEMHKTTSEKNDKSCSQKNA